MMLGMPWWVWLVLLVAGVLLLASRAAKAWRASIRRDFVEYLRREAPEVEIVLEQERELTVRTAGGGEGTLRLDRLYTEGSHLPSDDPAGRQALFAQCVGMIRDGGQSLVLNAERDRQRVLPRLVNDAFLGRLRADARNAALPALASGVPGLSVVLVLDGESSVAYLTDEHLLDLKLTPDEGLCLAKENLSRSFAPEVVRRALSDRSVNVVKSGDTFDAARLLLVPGCLHDGEEVAALIPDRDTLVVTAVPADHDWSSLSKLAKASAGEPLWPEPLVVTSMGVSRPQLA